MPPSLTSTRLPTILIYGATSFVGTLLIGYLKYHQDKDLFRYILAGRNGEKLAKLKEGLKVGDEVETIACALVEGEEGRKNIDDMVRRCDVVINLAGPYSSHNASLLVFSCASLGVHYTDLTGETPWIRSIIDNYDHLAWTNRACIVPSCGFDSLPSDSLVFLGAQELVKKRILLGQTDSDDHPASADIKESLLFVNSAGGVSGGTIASAVALMEMESKERTVGTGEFALTKTTTGTPSPAIKLVYSDPSLDMYGGFFVMSPVNTATVRRTWYLLNNFTPRFLRPTNTDSKPNPTTPPTRAFKYGSNFTYQESLTVGSRGSKGSWGMSAVVTVLTAAFGLALQYSRGFRWLIGKWMPAGSGPSTETMRNGYLEATNITRSVGGQEVVSTMSIDGDPAYYQTATMIAESALTLILDHSSLPEIGQNGGVLTPMTAMGNAVIKRLEESGRMRYWTGGVEEWKVRQAEMVRKYEEEKSAKEKKEA